MPHSFSGGFYTTTKVSDKPEVNHDSNHKPQLSHVGGQNATNTKTEQNDTNKQ